MSSRVFRILLLVAWCALIFYVTASPSYTFDSTYSAVQTVASRQWTAGTLRYLTLYLRKSVHLVGFGVLAVLCWRALEGLSMASQGAWVFATLYAVSDEWHQSFMPGRTPAVADVALDSLGAAVALVLVYLYRHYRSRTTN